MPGPDGTALFTAEPLTIEDLTLLAELFYLPYEHGNKAVQMLREFNWLRANSSVVSVNCKRKETEKVRRFVGGRDGKVSADVGKKRSSSHSSVLETKWWICTTLNNHWGV